MMRIKNFIESRPWHIVIMFLVLFHIVLLALNVSVRFFYFVLLFFNFEKRMYNYTKNEIQ